MHCLQCNALVVTPSVSEWGRRRSGRVTLTVSLGHKLICRPIYCSLLLVQQFSSDIASALLLQFVYTTTLLHANSLKYAAFYTPRDCQCLVLWHSPKNKASVKQNVSTPPLPCVSQSSIHKMDKLRQVLSGNDANSEETEGFASQVCTIFVKIYLLFIILWHLYDYGDGMRWWARGVGAFYFIFWEAYCYGSCYHQSRVLNVIYYDNGCYCFHSIGWCNRFVY